MADQDELHRLFEQIEGRILHSPRTLNRVETVEAAGVSLERATALWRALGFPATDSDEEVLFTDADVEALRKFDRLVETGVVDSEVERSIVRSMGRSFARLAEWEVTDLARVFVSGGADVDEQALVGLVDELLPAVEELQNYIWRRHVAAATARLLLMPASEDGAVKLAVGFADIVGFTRRSRGLKSKELERLVEVFEECSGSVVTQHGGRVIKTIGDEVMFVADDPVDLGRIALALMTAHEHTEDFPEIRIGAAYGEVLTRLGDVFGPVVNIASRLTSLCRPSRALVDRDLSAALEEHPEEFRVKRSRTTAVKGYSRLETWSLRPARG